MRIIVQMFIFLTFCSISAQLPQHLIKPVKKTTMFDQYVGSIYVNDEYQQSDVIDEKSGTYSANLRYNTYTDAIEYDQGNRLFEIAKNPTTHVRLGDEYYYYCTFKNQRGFNKYGYYVLIELNDQYRIYKKNELKISQPKENDVITGTSTMGKVKTFETYYMETNGKLVELPTNKKDLLAVFSDQEEELKKYLKQEKIRLKKQEDLVRFVAKYNALKNSNVSQSRSLLSNTVQNN